jgi:CRP/FNR family transcriptional regulator, cyclic AMP receptor protein
MSRMETISDADSPFAQKHCRAPKNAPPNTAVMKSSYGLSAECLNCRPQPDDFFCALSEEPLKAFDHIKHTAVLSDDAVIFVAGQTPRGIFLLCEGRAKLLTISSVGRTLILQIAKPGNVIGLHEVITGKPYELTAETIQPCRLNFVSRDDFLPFLKNHGDACLQAVHHLIRGYRKACDVVRSVALPHSISGRLAKFLLESSAEGQVATEIAVTREEIAQLTGTCRETIWRILSEFRRKSIAELDGSTLVIHNKPALERLAAT